MDRKHSFGIGWCELPLPQGSLTISEEFNNITNPFKNDKTD